MARSDGAFPKHHGVNEGVVTRYTINKRSQIDHVCIILETNHGTQELLLNIPTIIFPTL